MPANAVFQALSVCLSNDRCLSARTLHSLSLSSCVGRHLLAGSSFTVSSEQRCRSTPTCSPAFIAALVAQTAAGVDSAGYVMLGVSSRRPATRDCRSNMVRQRRTCARAEDHTNSVSSGSRGGTTTALLEGEQQRCMLERTGSNDDGSMIDSGDGASEDSVDIDRHAASSHQRQLEGLIATALEDDRALTAFDSYLRLVDAGGFPSERTCERLLKGLAGSGNFQPCWALYVAATQRGVPLRYTCYLAVMTAANKAGRHGAALRAFQDIKAAGMQPNVVTYCGIISGLAGSRQDGFVRSAHRLWQELQRSGQHLDAAAYRTGINVYVEMGDLRAAQQVLAAMRDMGHSPDAQAWNMLIKGYARAGLLTILPDLIADMQLEGLRLNKVSYATLIEAHVRAGDLSEASQWAAAAHIAGVQLDAWAYTALLKGRLQAGDMAGARQVLEDMRAAGAPPNAVTYTVVMDSMVAAGDLKAARGLLDQMQAEGQQPTPVTFNTLLRGYAARGRAGRQGAAWVLKRMAAAGCGPDVASFNTLIGGAVASGDPGGALGLWRRMREAGVRQDTLTYTNLMEAHSQLRRVDDVIRTFEQLEADRRAPVDETAICAYVAALARGGRLRHAIALLPRADALAAAARRPPPIAAHGAIVDAHCRAGRLDAALAAVQNFGRPDARMYDRLVDAAMRNGDFRCALKVLRAMEAQGFELDKERYKALFAEVCRREEAARRAGRRRTAGNGDGTGAIGRLDSDGELPPNENLERFKFWLGLPNSYYRSQAD